ncbi:MAG TPA: VOC family protein [Aeromicrobium sp.]|jgi:catechol 2,3-dioxygenase-like lactoylglutathione lyase family enzyme|nr:VOC family protein [Aeromicrobium sp.]HKY58665.1 VOC family protein [Aeromicrobium sp.]
MTITINNAFLTVHDKDIALTFYRDALGMELVGDVERGGSFWATLALPEQPGVNLVLSDPHAGRSPEDGDTMARLLAKGALNGVSFAVADLDETFEKVRASGADVMQEPMDQPWGARDCAFRDPSGNMIRINQA